MLKEDINAYVALQRAMGFKFKTQNYLLQHYSRYCGQHNETTVRSQTVITWAGLAPSVQQKRNRLLTVRRFAIAMQAENGQYEVPPDDIYGHEGAKRKIRHLFSSEEIRLLLAAASELKPHESIRPKTYTTLYALLAATGIRSGEAIKLNIDDLTADGLMIRATKFRKDRLVPIHLSTRQALETYLNYRKTCYSLEPAFFVSCEGTKLSYTSINHIYLQLMRKIGLRGKPGEAGPCLHDLRHTFAVRSLEQCTESRKEVSAHITALSTYLGHAHVSDTYWYLQATPLLMTQISESQESCFGRERL